MKKGKLITEAERYLYEDEEYQYTEELNGRCLNLLRDGVSFSARGRDWNVEVVDEAMAGEFVELYNDGTDDVFIRATPYWEGVHLPLEFYVDNGDIIYNEQYPLEDMTDASDEELKSYVIQNFVKAINDIPEDIFNQYIK